MNQPAKTEHKEYHSPHSPSSLKNWELETGGCPHYTSIESDEEHIITTQGTQLHAYMEHRISMIWEDDADYRFSTLTIEEEVTEEDYPLVPKDPELMALADWMEQFFRNYIMGHEDSLSAHWLLEQRLHTPFPTCNGRADFLMRLAPHRKPVELVLLDWKTGYHYQGDAEDNIQGLAYAIGAFQKFPEAEKITIYFAYPRNQEATYAEFTREQMVTGIRRIATTIEQRMRAEAPETSNEVPFNKGDACTYCALKGICPAWEKTVQDSVGALAEVDVQMMHARAPKPVTWNPEKLMGLPQDMAYALDIMDDLAAYHAELKKFAHLAMEEKDVLIPGRSLVHSKGKLTVQDVPKAIKLVPVDKLMPALSVSAPKLAKIYAKSMGCSEAKAREMLVEAEVAKLGEGYSSMRKASKRNTLKLT